MSNQESKSIKYPEEISPMRLVDIIRQSTTNFNTASCRGKSEYHSKVLLNKAEQHASNQPQREYFNKRIGKNYFYDKKNESSRLINSQTRILRSSQNDSITKKLYVQIRDLRDDIKASNDKSNNPIAKVVKRQCDESDLNVYINTSKDHNTIAEPSQKINKIRANSDILYATHTRHLSGHKVLSDIKKSLQKSLRDKRYSENEHFEDSEVHNYVAST